MNEKKTVNNSDNSNDALSEKDIERLKEKLIEQREHIRKKIESLQNDAVAGSDTTNWEEDGTDIFDREFAFKMAGSVNEHLNQIDDALRMIEDGTYGICEMCGKKIGRLRMEALPFCKTCIQCQSESEADNGLAGRITV